MAERGIQPIEYTQLDLFEAVLPERPVLESSYPTETTPTIRVKDLPAIEQPSERILLYGAKNRSAGELLATIIGNGKASQSSIAIAQNILVRVKELDQRGELSALQHMTPACLQSISGVTPAKAARIAAAVELGKRVFSPLPDLGMVIDDPTLASAYLAQDLMWEKQEKFAVLHLDTKHRVISKEVVTVGTNRETLAPPEEIFRSALEHRAYRILLAHNHPSGSTEPSPDDIELTKQMVAAGKVLNIKVLDHLVLGNGNHTSIRQLKGDLWDSETLD